MSSYISDLKKELGDNFRDDDIPMYLIACEISLFREAIEDGLLNIHDKLNEIDFDLP